MVTHTYSRGRRVAMLGAFVGLLTTGGGLAQAWPWAGLLAVLWVMKP